MREVTVVYSPQCPSNIHFINQMREWAKPYGAEVEAIDAFEEHERAAEHLKETPIGHTRHLFITVFVGWVLDRRILDAEVGMRRADGSPTVGYTLFRFFLRFTAPLAILAVIIAVILGKDFS